MFTDSYGNTRFPGVYRGLVTDNRDPLSRGRVQIQVPQVLGDATTDWAWAHYTPGVEHTTPDVGAGVWVMFEGGNPAYPVWSATFDSLGSIDYLQLNTEWTDGSTAVGQLAWSVDDETPEMVVGNGEVTLQIGQEFHVRVANNTGTDIPNGSVVYLFGGSDDHGHPYVAPYRADGTISPFRVVGVTTQVIPNDSEGLVTAKGKLRELDTSAYDAGDVLYASSMVYGGFQTTLATAPNDIVAVASVVKVGETDGEILVTVVPLINQLQTNLVFFPTTVASDVSGYSRLVNSTVDADYDNPAVLVSTGTLNSADDVLVGQLIADANEFVGNPGDVEVTITGSVGKTSGNSNTSAGFYFKVFKRTSGGTETLLGTSSTTSNVPMSENAPISPMEFSASANVVFDTFDNTDRLVVKFYANTVEDGSQSYTFTFGGVSPVRILVPVPVNVVVTPDAVDVAVDVTNFDGLLSAADTTVQAALDTLDDVTASELPVDTTNFAQNLSAADDTIQKALDTLDNLSIVSESTAAGTTVDVTNFDGNLSSADDTVQKALDTIDDLAFSGGGKVTVAATPPTSPTPAEGDIWVSDTDGASYVYYTDGTSDQWMQIGASTAAYPPAAFVDVVSSALDATVEIIALSTSTPRFVHPEIVVSTTTDSFQVTKAGYYEFGFEGAATSVESGNRVTIQAYVSTTSPPATAPATTFRDVRTFDSAVAAGTIAVNGSWFNYLTPNDYVAFYVSCNTTDGTISTNGQVYIRRIG